MLRPIDPKRVYLTGMSNGGFMVERLACAGPDLIAGAEIVAAPLCKSQSTACGSAPVVPVANMLGSRDTWIHLAANLRSEEHTSECKSIMRSSYAVVCLDPKNRRYI